MHLPTIQKLVKICQHLKTKVIGWKGDVATVNYVDEVLLFCYPSFLLHEYFSI